MTKLIASEALAAAVPFKDLDTLLENLEASKFKDLQGVWNYITLDDLRFLGHDDLLSLVPADNPKKRVLAQLFLKKYLNAFQQSDPFSSFQEAKEHDAKLALAAGKFVFSGRVISSRFASVARDRIPMSNLDALNIQNLDKVLVLDFSECELWDCDMQYVFRLASKCTACTHVNLSDNRFYQSALDDALRSLLNLSSILYVDITINPLASVDRIDFFKTLDSSQLRKLIFIPAAWLQGEGWRVMIREQVSADSTLVQAVMTTHQKYYASL